MPKAEEKKEIKTPVEAPVAVQVVPKVAVKLKKDKTYSFEQWAQVRKKLPRHLRGMRAFLGAEVSNFKYPLEKWDEIFKSY